MHVSHASMNRGDNRGSRRAKGLKLKWFPISNVRSPLGEPFQPSFSISRLFSASSRRVIFGYSAAPNWGRRVRLKTDAVGSAYFGMLAGTGISGLPRTARPPRKTACWRA